MLQKAIGVGGYRPVLVVLSLFNIRLLLPAHSKDKKKDNIFAFPKRRSKDIEKAEKLTKEGDKIFKDLQLEFLLRKTVKFYNN